MSKRSLLSIVTASLVAYSFLFVTSLAVAQDNQDSQMVTFEKATGGTFYALSLKPNVQVNDDRGTDVLLLFDTSASQTHASKPSTSLKAETGRQPLRGTPVPTTCGTAGRANTQDPR